MKKSLKKILAVLAVGGTFAGYVFSQKTSNDVFSNSKATNSSPVSTTVSTTTKTSTTPVSVSKPVVKSKLATVTIPTPIPKPKPTGAFVDGTYTGNVADAFYGNIQVQAVVRNGALADVVFLQYPSDRSRSISINTMAMPRLKSEAITAQSANVNTISGASASSQAFVQSLQSALDQAKV